MTIEEQERLLYITNDPAHPLAAVAYDESWFLQDEQEHEIRMLKEELKEANRKLANG
jgi:hypothetical protein